MINKVRKLFIFAVLISIVFSLGYLSARIRVFPSQIIDPVLSAVREMTAPKWYYFDSQDSIKIKTNKPGACEWPLLISEIGANDSLIVKIIDNKGKIIHKWNLEWFNIWKDANHLPDELTPKQRPGTHIHGIHIFDDGSIVFNFEQRGLVRLDKNGKILWRLPAITDHSVYFDGSVLWVCAQIHHSQPIVKYPGFVPPFIEPLILKVSPDGKIIDKTSVFDLLLQNKLEGLIYSASTSDFPVKFSGSIIHLNDVEPFPKELQSGFYGYGDVMLSLRNSNSIIIYNDSSKVVKEVIIGEFVRQHDPDFMDGNSISIYDNHNIRSSDPDQQSRILIRSHIDQKTITFYQGNLLSPFNSTVMGKHQWLSNGNLLITEPQNGRAFEINPNREIVWEYLNLVEKNKLGLLDEASRIHPDKLKPFLKN